MLERPPEGPQTSDWLFLRPQVGDRLLQQEKQEAGSCRTCESSLQRTGFTSWAVRQGPKVRFVDTSLWRVALVKLKCCDVQLRLIGQPNGQTKDSGRHFLEKAPWKLCKRWGQPLEMCAHFVLATDDLQCFRHLLQVAKGTPHKVNGVNGTNGAHGKVEAVLAAQGPTSAECTHASLQADRLARTNGNGTVVAMLQH